MHLIEIYILHLLTHHKVLLEQIAPSEPEGIASLYASLLFELQVKTGLHLSEEEAFLALKLTVQDLAQQASK